eukprot:CAMPEP_0119155138 /NCGR_PEP_ID=MMETSP1310-20130426/51591_1 /TAXON_ID=464262 /ORGANISM="Genus nov. species nov., Strain RCC2339" /LENGTH=653 /DNA_ID=CAMNT_0007147725 /DNA_START=182 /DNA_END=2140 /DNA_ORIENTATION=+
MKVGLGVSFVVVLCVTVVAGHMPFSLEDVLQEAGETMAFDPQANDIDPCVKWCGFNVSWDDPQFVCGSDGVSHANTACYGSTPFVGCHISVYAQAPPFTPNSWSVVGAGTCECPSDCTGHGTCGAEACTCNDGYTGVDCASILLLLGVIEKMKVGQGVSFVVVLCVAAVAGHSPYSLENVLQEAGETLAFDPQANDIDPCDKWCGFDVSWDDPQYVCGSDGVTHANTACYGTTPFTTCHNTVYASVPPFTPNSWSVVGAGTCECPSDCTGHGTCGAEACTCDDGYTGVDCASIQCSSASCNGRGTCKNFHGIGDKCMCNDGYAGSDCIAVMGAIPPTPQLVPEPEYSPEDPYGDDHPIFNQSTIAVVHFRLAQKDLDYLIDPSHTQSDIYFPADMHFLNGAGIDRTLPQVGFRIKGGASRNYAKKTWKVDLKEFIDQKDIAGIDKMGFKAASQTPSYVREIASLQALRSMSSPAQRSSYAEVYINDLYWGLYIMLEEQGQGEFLESRFGTKDGPLWKCSFGSNLKYEGHDPEIYANMTEVYRPQNDIAEEDESWAAFAHFIEVLNLTPPEYFEEEIRKVLDVEFFLRTLSAEVMTGNWDGLWNTNNYMLYLHPDDGKFRYYRYDVENAFGSYPIFNFETRNIWEWGKGGLGHL